MEMLNRDAQQLLGLAVKPNKQQMTLLESVQYDVDTAFGDMQQLDFSNNVDHISVGGQILGPGRDFTINLFEDKAIQNIMTLGIAGKINFIGDNRANCRVLNTLMFFEGFGAKIGHSPFTQTYGLELMSKSQLQPYADGLWLDLDEHNNFYNNLGDYAAVMEQKMKRASFKLGSDNNFFVPLWMIFPWLKDIPQCALSTGNGQKLSFSIRTTLASECLAGISGVGNALANNTYQISNIGIVHQYSRLDDSKYNQILQNSYIFHPIIADQQVQAVLTSSNQLRFQISKTQRLKRLVFGFSSNKAPIGATAAYTTNALLFGENAISSPLYLFPKIKINRCRIDVGGDKIIYDSDVIQVLHYVASTQTHNQQMFFEGGLHQGYTKDLRCVYAIDISRFPEDLIGASSKEHTTVNVTIDIDTNPLFNRLIMTTDADGPSAGELANFSLYGFLEMSQQLHLSQGQYKW